jgi:amino acid permease
MKVRHLVMLSLGGVIGTGLFFNTGYIFTHHFYPYGRLNIYSEEFYTRHSGELQ